MQGREDAQKQKMAEADRAWAEAPKRSASEPIRVVLVGPTTGTPELEPLAGTYREMMEQALRDHPRIQLVPYAPLKVIAEATSDDRRSGLGQSQVRTAVDEGLTRRLRDTNSGVDAVLVAHLAPKRVSGLVSGGGGMGVAEVNNVQFDASLSSVYLFHEFQGSQVGKSTDSLSLAGVNKSGKKGSADLKQKRNPESDRPRRAEVRGLGEEHGRAGDRARPAEPRSGGGAPREPRRRCGERARRRPEAAHGGQKVEAGTPRQNAHPAPSCRVRRRSPARRRRDVQRAIAAGARYGTRA